MTTHLPRHLRQPDAIAGAAAGRPRTFVPTDALRLALHAFWENGYAATSLADLTAAMGLGRSSFYACFGSKRAVLLAAVELYADTLFAQISAIADDAADPMMALHTLVKKIADIDAGRRGCFLINCVTELAPHDPALAAFSQRHIARVTALMTALLVRAGLPAPLAETRAMALLATAIGTTSLRKAGIPAMQLQALLDQAQRLLLALPPANDSTPRSSHAS